MSDPCVGVVGLGFLGRGIVTCLLGHGLRVVGYARDEEEHAAARRTIERGMKDWADIATPGHGPSPDWSDRYVATEQYDALAPCGFVIESVTEDIDIKRSVFDAIEQAIDPGVPIASNTSAIPIGVLQDGRRNPARFIGMHWAEPAYANRFLEVIRGEQTSDDTVAATVTLAQSVGKDPAVLNKDVPGFIANRLAYAVFREAMHLLESGVADAQTIDRAFRNALGIWGGFCGPLRWIDLTGGPTLYARAMKPVLEDLSNQTNVPDSLKELAEAGAQGIANGSGYYHYTPEEARQWEQRFREHALAAWASALEANPRKTDET